MHWHCTRSRTILCCSSRCDWAHRSAAAPGEKRRESDAEAHRVPCTTNKMFSLGHTVHTVCNWRDDIHWWGMPEQGIRNIRYHYRDTYMYIFTWYCYIRILLIRNMYHCRCFVSLLNSSWWTHPISSTFAASEWWTWFCWLDGPIFYSLQQNGWSGCRRVVEVVGVAVRRLHLSPNHPSSHKHTLFVKHFCRNGVYRVETRTDRKTSLDTPNL